MLDHQRKQNENQLFHTKKNTHQVIMCGTADFYFYNLNAKRKPF